MATITSTGIGSGLDVNTIVSKLMSIEQQPVVDLQTKATSMQAQLSSYGQLQSAISSLRDAAAKLNTPATWGANLSTSSDNTVATASTSQASVAGNYSVSISQLATAQTINTVPYPLDTTATTSIGQGSLTIELGAWSADQSTFTPTTGKSPVTINIGPGEDTLTGARDKINAAGAGVVASVVTDSQGSRLVLRSTNTGANNGFRVSASESSPGPDGGPGLSALAFDPSSGVSNANQAQAAQSAMGTINGIPVVSDSNTVANVIDGLTVNFNKITTGTPGPNGTTTGATGNINISIGPDTAGITKSINDFVSSYNALTTFMKAQTKYTPKSGTTPASAGPLQGDATAIGLQGQLRTLASNSTTLGGTYSRFGDIGLDPQVDGTLVVNASKLSAAMGNVDSLKKMFSGLDPSNSSNNGITQQIADLATTALSFDGSLTTKQASLRSSLDRNAKDQDTINNRLTLVEARMRASYQALDTSMASLTSLSNYVSQQFGGTTTTTK